MRLHLLTLKCPTKWTANCSKFNKSVNFRSTSDRTKCSSEVIVAYHGHQLAHRYADSECKHLIGLTIGAACFIMITSFSVLIGFWDYLNYIFAIAIGMASLLTTCVTGVIISFAADMIGISKKFVCSHRRNESKLTAVFRRQLKTCKPLEVSISNFNKLSKATYPYIMSEVVLSKVVDMLLMWTN